MYQKGNNVCGTELARENFYELTLGNALPSTIQNLILPVGRMRTKLLRKC